MTEAIATSDLLTRARAWVAEDPDEATRAELLARIDAVQAGDAEETVELADAFAGTLEFGTAGLRGKLGPGPNRMNRVVVIRAAAGLARYLLDHGAGPDDSVAVGFDARYNSDVFARDTAEVITGAGLRAIVMPRTLPTPLVPWTILDQGCIAGVMVTASHNPPQDNGYKVYLGDGSQIVPPADAEIAQRIAAVGAPAEVPRGDGGSVVPEAVVQRYLDTTAALVAEGPRDVKIVYTAMHGVGGESVMTLLPRAGFGAPIPVPEQFEPDPAFPTVAFPNPEEPGAMDLALALAVAEDADLVIANDPDADRCAAAVQDFADDNGTWRMLRGDEVGALLAHHLLSRGRQGVWSTSIVSSSLLAKLAAAAGQPFTETLTGFKWIGRLDNLAYGYEEALGYCVDPEHVKDKDGVSAALMLAELAAATKTAGRTLIDILDDIARAHGLHATDQLSVRVEDLSLIDAAMQRLRSQPPARLGGLAVEQVEDLSTGSADLPPTNGLRYRLAEHGRVIVRPSGTEPKIKCYLEVVVPVAPDGDVTAARRVAAERLTALKQDVAAAAGL